MLHASSSEMKSEATQSKSAPVPLPVREQHPPLAGWASSQRPGGISNQMLLRSPDAQLRQQAIGIQQSYGNQGALRMLRVQHSAGNRAVQLMIQTKLEISQPGDVYEQEADRVAEQVVHSSAPSVIQRQCACGGTSGSAGECEACQQKRLDVQRRARPDAKPLTIPPSVQETLRTSGQPLDAPTRAFMEPRFGQDFSRVRIHTDEEAANSARSVQARAYTVGHHIVFGSGEYAVATAEGKKLLAHELTHVVQQRSASADGVIDETQIDEEGDMVAVDGGNLQSIQGVDLGPVLQRQDQSVAPRIRVVTNHQFPLTAANVSAGLRSGNGGVSEMEVSNGVDNFNGQSVSESFVGESGDNVQVGGCNNAQGQGGQGGSTFTIGQPVTFSRFGININLPAKTNTFYDVHIKAFSANILPPGVNRQFSSCQQQYIMGGVTLNGGQIFNRVHNITRTNISGQDVANIDLAKS